MGEITSRKVVNQLCPGGNTGQGFEAGSPQLRDIESVWFAGQVCGPGQECDANDTCAGGNAELWLMLWVGPQEPETSS